MVQNSIKSNKKTGLWQYIKSFPGRVRHDTEVTKLKNKHTNKYYISWKNTVYIAIALYLLILALDIYLSIGYRSWFFFFMFVLAAIAFIALSGPLTKVVLRIPIIWTSIQRSMYLILAAAISFFLFTMLEISLDDNNFFGLLQLFISPVLFILWFYRDTNRLREINSKRKDTNLKEFQQLQQWATGNFSEYDKSQTKQREALQISALHSLVPYLKGVFGADFRRGAFEIFTSVLRMQHKLVFTKLKEVKEVDNEVHDAALKLMIKDNIRTGHYYYYIEQVIECNELTKQINRIASENWFSLIVDHGFPTATISLVGVDLRDAYLRHEDFDKCLDLSDADLSGAYLYGADLQGANLTRAQLKSIYLHKAQLQSANLVHAHLQGANLEAAHLQGANLEGANLEGANLVKANLSSSYLQGANLSYALLQKANLSCVYLQSANLSEVMLQSANLSHAQLFGANLFKATLNGANLEGAQLQGADLSYVKLRGVNLKEAQLQCVDLTGAYYLFAAILCNTKLQGAVSNSDINKRFSHAHRLFEKIIMEQVKQKADINGVSKEILNTVETDLLAKELSQFLNDVKVNAIITRIKNAKGHIDTIGAEMGSYSEQQAHEWIDEYNQAT